MFINLNHFEDVAARIYQTVAASDESVTSFLQDKGVLQDQDLCEKHEDPIRLANNKSRGQDRMIWSWKWKGFLSRLDTSNSTRPYYTSSANQRYATRTRIKAAGHILYPQQDFSFSTTPKEKQHEKLI